MTHIDYTSAPTKRARQQNRIRRALRALLSLALMLTLASCGLLKDRSATALTIDDAAQIDLADLVKYEQLQELDVRKAIITLDDYLLLQDGLPDCRILWSVPIMDQRYDNQVTQLTLPVETDALALDLLRYFPNLVTVDARGCSCYDALMSKSLERQDITFYWQVEIGGVTLQNTDDMLDLSGKTLDAEALMRSIYFLPGLTTVDITDTNIGAAEGAALEARYPNIRFLRTIDLFGVQVNTDVTELDLTGATISNDGLLLDALLPLKKMTSCDLTGQTISFDTMDALRGKNPLVTFQFSFELFGQQLTPETTQLDLQGQTFLSAEEVAAGLLHLPDLAWCDLSGTGLSSEQMLLLQEEFPAVKLVWQVQVGAWLLRTDIEAFTTQNRKQFPGDAAIYTDTGSHNLTDADLAELAFCTDLVYLDLYGSQVSDLSFIEQLPKLRLLCIANNHITDISALSALAELEYLEIYMNAVSDFSPLAGLTKLASLNIARTALGDISALSGMKQLKMLWLMNNKITKDDLTKLADALPDCTIASRGSSSTSGDWHKIELYHTFEILTGLAEPDPTPTPEPASAGEETPAPIAPAE